jgi:hypothetical protein
MPMTLGPNPAGSGTATRATGRWGHVQVIAADAGDHRAAVHVLSAISHVQHRLTGGRLTRLTLLHRAIREIAPELRGRQRVEVTSWSIRERACR